MSFAAPLWLLAGGLAAVVVILHALRHTLVEVPSVILWRRLVTKGRSRSTLRPPRWSWLLLLQVLAVLLLGAALAQPIIGPNRQPLHEVFILDASGSMRATDVEPSRFAAARSSLLGRLRDIEEGARVSVLLAGSEPGILYARQPEAKALVPAIERLEAGDGNADWASVASRLASVVRDGEDTRLTVLTDAGDAPRAAIGDAYTELPIAIESFGTDMAANAALAAMLTPEEDGAKGWRLSGTVTVTGEDAAPPEIAVRFMPVSGGGVLDWTSIPLEAEPEENGAGVATYAFETPLDLPADGLVILALPQDAFPHDNEIGLVARQAPPRIRALYVGRGNRTLELALLSRTDVDLFSAETLPANSADYDLVIADGVMLSERPATNMLWLGASHLAAEAAPASVSGPVVGWDDEHPLSQGMRWSAISEAGALGTALMPGARALLRTRDAVLVQARTTPSGREVRLGLPTEPGGWVDTPLFPTFFSNVVDWLGAGDPVLCAVGRECNVPARLVDEDVYAPEGDVVRPAARDAVALLDDAVSFVPRRTGIHRVGEGTEATTIFVNPDPAERAVAAASAGETATVPPSRPLRAAFWLIALAGLVLLGEAVVAGRGTERFFDREAMARGTPGSLSRRWTLGFRLASLLLVVCALLSVPLPAPGPAEDTILVIAPYADGNASRPALAANAQAAACNPFLGDSLGLIAMAGTPRIIEDTCPRADSSDNTAPSATGEDLRTSIGLAAAMVQPGRNGRIVVAADGSEASSIPGSAVGALAERNLRIDAISLADWPAGDTLVGTVDLPPRIVGGDRPPLEALIHSATGVAAPLEITVAADGEIVDRQDVAIQPGSNRVQSMLPALAEGPHTIDVTIGGIDPEPANNSFATAVTVEPAPLVAIVTSQTEWAQYVADALELHGIRTEIMRPNRAPFYMDKWLEYSAVALLNVPAIDLDSRQQDQLEQYVRLHGRGLLILGGENSFGPGGYFQTPLEAISPLSARVPKDMPVAALGFVLDRSGSMQAQVEGATRLDIAREATLSAVELLNDESQVSVVVFDTEATRLVPMQDRKDTAALEAALSRLEPGGGTSIYPGLEQMIEEMSAADSPVRHIVVMSDGLTQPGDFQTLIARARGLDITISAVAIGSGADVSTLEDIARAGGGAFHATRDFRALPSILSQEAMMLNDEAMEVGVRPVAWLAKDQPFLEGLPDPMPPIESYVLTTPKPEAELHLATEDDEGELVPILASWHYGNGKVMALATHGAGPGSVRWMQLPEYPLLWAQALRHFLPTTPGPGITVRMARDGDQLRLAAQILDENAEPMAGLTPEARISVDGTTLGAPLPLAEIGEGRYEATFEAAQPGTYDADVRAGDDLVATTRFIVPYPSTLAFHRASPAHLETLAAATGGRVVSADEPLAVARAQWGFEQVWRPWVLLALATLLTDLAIRYVPGLFPFLRDRPSAAASRRVEVPA